MYAYMDPPDKPPEHEVRKWDQLRGMGIHNYYDLVDHYVPGLTDDEKQVVLEGSGIYPSGNIHRIEYYLKRIQQRRMA